MSQDDTNSRIQKLIADNPVMLFMKGTPTFPQCGFSATVVSFLDHLQVDYESTNVLEDQEIREDIKVFSTWPTIPQIYVKGEFLGGCDIAKEMFQSGELKQVLVDEGLVEA